MAIETIDSRFVSINAVQLDDHGVNATVSITVDAQEYAVYGAGGKSRLSGLTDWSAEVEFMQDFAAAEVDATLSGAIGSIIACEFRKDNAGRSSTNPAYHGNMIITTYTPIQGAPKDQARAVVSLLGAEPYTRSTT